LLVRSIEMTIRHPLFGVGTGMFQVAENSAAVDQGMRKGMWHDTHNMFTEVSSENGILAGLAFLAMFVIALRRLSLVYRRYRDAKDPQGASLAGMAFGLRTAVIAFMVSGFFLSCAYTELTVVLVALTVVVDRKAAAFTEGSPAVSRFMESPVAVPARVRVAAQVSPNRAEQPVPSGSLYRLRGLRRPNPPAGRM
jgi:O-antigen ligase